jgi:hypothetical protein
MVAGVQTALLTKPVWPWKVARSLPLAVSQSRAVVSHESTCLPSGLKTALLTLFSMALENNQQPAARSLPEPRRSIP